MLKLNIFSKQECPFFLCIAHDKNELFKNSYTNIYVCNKFID